MISLYNALKLTGDFHNDEYVYIRNLSIKGNSGYTYEYEKCKSYCGSIKELTEKVDLRKIQVVKIIPKFETYGADFLGMEYICR